MMKPIFSIFLQYESKIDSVLRRMPGDLASVSKSASEKKNDDLGKDLAGWV